MALTKLERMALEDLEQIIERGMKTFVEVGAALSQIREKKLYRETHDTFEEYVSERWQLARRRAYQLMEASDVVMQMEDADVNHGTHPPTLPSNERQARELAKVEPEKRAEVMEKASEDGPATAKKIREASAPPPEPELDEPEEEEVDPWEELERQSKEVLRLMDLVETLKTSDLAVECAQWSEKYARLEGRLHQLSRSASEAEKTATYATKMLKKIREKLGVERNSQILPALDS